MFGSLLLRAAPASCISFPRARAASARLVFSACPLPTVLAVCAVGWSPSLSPLSSSPACALWEAGGGWREGEEGEERQERGRKGQGRENGEGGQTREERRDRGRRGEREKREGRGGREGQGDVTRNVLRVFILHDIVHSTQVREFFLICQRQPVRSQKRLHALHPARHRVVACTQLRILVLQRLHRGVFALP